jgi:hypothetical protein
MTRTFLSKGAMIAAASAVAIMLAVAGGANAQTKKSAKMAAPPPPPAPGFCTAKMNELKWGNMSYRSQGGEVVPTLAVCYDTHCPAPC